MSQLTAAQFDAALNAAAVETVAKASMMIDDFVAKIAQSDDMPPELIAAMLASRITVGVNLVRQAKAGRAMAAGQESSRVCHAAGVSDLSRYHQELPYATTFAAQQRLANQSGQSQTVVINDHGEWTFQCDPHVGHE